MMAKEQRRISENPENFTELFGELRNLSELVISKKVDVRQGTASAKALFGAAKVLESDLHARIFAHRVTAEGSGQAALTNPKSLPPR
jgi:hypothetical protein